MRVLRIRSLVTTLRVLTGAAWRLVTTRGGSLSDLKYVALVLTRDLIDIT